MRSHIPPPPEPVVWTSPALSPLAHRRAICVHNWHHVGVRWWIDASDPLVSWFFYVDQFYCPRCLEVEGRPIDYRHRLDDLSPTPGTFAVDSELGARLRDAAFAKVTQPAAETEPAAPAAAGAPPDRAG